MSKCSLSIFKIVLQITFFKASCAIFAYQCCIVVLLDSNMKV